MLKDRAGKMLAGLLIIVLSVNFNISQGEQTKIDARQDKDIEMLWEALDRCRDEIKSHSLEIPETNSSDSLYYKLKDMELEANARRVELNARFNRLKGN